MSNMLNTKKTSLITVLLLICGTSLFSARNEAPKYSVEESVLKKSLHDNKDLCCITIVDRNRKPIKLILRTDGSLNNTQKNELRRKDAKSVAISILNKLKKEITEAQGEPQISRRLLGCLWNMVVKYSDDDELSNAFRTLVKSPGLFHAFQDVISNCANPFAIGDLEQLVQALNDNKKVQEKDPKTQGRLISLNVPSSTKVSHTSSLLKKGFLVLTMILPWFLPSVPTNNMTLVDQAVDISGKETTIYFPEVKIEPLWQADLKSGPITFEVPQEESFYQLYFDTYFGYMFRPINYIFFDQYANIAVSAEKELETSTLLDRDSDDYCIFFKYITKKNPILQSKKHFNERCTEVIVVKDKPLPKPKDPVDHTQALVVLGAQQKLIGSSDNNTIFNPMKRTIRCTNLASTIDFGILGLGCCGVNKCRKFLKRNNKEKETKVEEVPEGEQTPTTPQGEKASSGTSAAASEAAARAVAASSPPEEGNPVQTNPKISESIKSVAVPIALIGAFSAVMACKFGGAKKLQKIASDGINKATAPIRKLFRGAYNTVN